MQWNEASENIRIKDHEEFRVAKGENIVLHVFSSSCLFIGTDCKYNFLPVTILILFGIFGVCLFWLSNLATKIMRLGGYK